METVRQYLEAGKEIRLYGQPNPTKMYRYNDSTIYYLEYCPKYLKDWSLLKSHNKETIRVKLSEIYLSPNYFKTSRLNKVKSEVLRLIKLVTN